MTLKNCWIQGRSNVKVVCDEETDCIQHRVDIQNISLKSILSHDALTAPQQVLVLCNKMANSDGTDSDILHQQQQQTECFSIFPSLLTVPLPFTGEFLIFLSKILCRNAFISGFLCVGQCPLISRRFYSVTSVDCYCFEAHMLIVIWDQ